jgi:anti-anti-sigma regulatory factor
MIRLEPLAPGRARLAGELDDDAARVLVGDCRSLPLPADSKVVLELGELELLTGTACGLVVDALRELLRRGAQVTLIEAPQALAHVLYRTGDLPRFALIRTRLDEATSP